MNTNDLVYEIAKRVKALANERMPVLRRVAGAGVTCRTRGDLIEWVIIEEFIEEFPKEIQE